MFFIEKAITGGRRYWLWIFGLCVVMALGLASYTRQLSEGLAITGLSRDITWGLYIAQFTFFVGVAASAVTVVLPYYLHNFKVFGRITILGEFLAIASVAMCGLFIFVDMGRPERVWNVLLYAAPGSIMFWDMLALGGYLALNAAITLATISAEAKGVAPARWVRGVILLSIPWAVSIHTVTAFLYSGLAGRELWLTALLAPRFLASAFAAGPALLILLCLLLRVGAEPIQKLTLIVVYATLTHLFFLLTEAFTALYSGIPEHLEHLRYLYMGGLAPCSWASLLLAVAALVLLRKALAVACGALLAALWIDKGLCLVVGGFVPSPLGAVSNYIPTLTEISIVAAIWSFGALLVTLFFRITLSVREELG